MLIYCRIPPTDKELQMLSDRIGRELDNEFSEFFHKFNGGEPVASVLTLEEFEIELDAVFPLTISTSPNLIQATFGFEAYGDKKGTCLQIGRFSAGDNLLVDTVTWEIKVLFRGRIQKVSSDIWSFFRQLEARSDACSKVDVLVEIAESGDVSRLNKYAESNGDIDQVVDGNSMIEIGVMNKDWRFVDACIALGAKTKGVKSTLRNIAAYDTIDELTERWPNIEW